MRGATAPVPPSQRRARIPHGLVTALRVGASAGLLALLIIISRDELSALDVGSKSAAAAWLTGAALVIAAAFVMAAVRWWQVADTLDVRVSGRSTLSIYLAALFVGNFLPTTIGGDVLRVNRLARICGSQANAFATVIIERLTGWVVLPLLTLAALISQPSLLSHSGGQIAGGLALGTLVVLALIVWVAEHPRGLGRLAGGTRIREALGAVHTGLSVFRRHPGAAGRLLTVGLAYQFLLVVATVLAGAAIGVNPGLRAWLAFAPMVLIVQNLSAIGGLGVREGALVLFLDAHGVNEGEAVLLGLLVYALTLLVSLTGAPALALGGRRNRSKVPAEVPAGS
ncbi:MAG: flippase-like domain-containing protein [Acidimicrobiales bacterium]|nr:flippase-like domain-containing protein [Acidimicrobiales bacterium]MYB81319.1 flippase-like domain-containing protein [Acidimicrobiales bacterium]MYI12737.1 flippase-like domain-containing protein [Acidimicrobiales bacterium]